MIKVTLDYRKPDNTLIKRGLYHHWQLLGHVDVLLKNGHAIIVTQDNQPIQFNSEAERKAYLASLLVDKKKSNGFEYIETMRDGTPIVDAPAIEYADGRTVYDNGTYGQIDNETDTPQMVSQETTPQSQDDNPSPLDETASRDEIKAVLDEIGIEYDGRLGRDNLYAIYQDAIS